MTAAKTERSFRGALFTGALRVGLTVLACWAFNACNLNPRPEGSAALDGIPPFNGGAGGKASIPNEGFGGSNFSGNGGAPAASAGGGSNPGGLDASSGPTPTDTGDAAADAAPDSADSGASD